MPNKACPGGLYALVDDGIHVEVPVLEKARAVIEGGAKVLQLRLKRASDRAAVETIRQVLQLARPANVTVIVNDRVDWAQVTGADGVHLGADDLEPGLARQLLGPDRLIGVTTRNLGEIQVAQAQGADHVGLGPIFATRTKTVGVPPLGLAEFEAIAKAAPLPVVGIAGIALENIGLVARAGAHAAAVAGDLFLTDDVVSRAKALQRAFWHS